MDLLKRALAPITEEAWTQIDEQAKDTLVNTLTARKVVDVIGPKGWDYNAVGYGRLIFPDKQEKDEVHYGLYEVQPLLEARVPFTLDLWELDNATRGAQDVDLDPVIAAARKIALFEERAIYHGLPKAVIHGLVESSGHEPIRLTQQPEEFFKGISRGVTNLHLAGMGEACALVINPDLWNEAASAVQGYPLQRRVEELINGNVIWSPTLEGALLVATRGGDFELVIGQDLTVGYESHTSQDVTLFLTESFTFRVLEPKAIIHCPR
ncbi:bacteriocin [candidate division KSB3 bacterium]|uniref:Bacteriocin n=1 Tax=candidate division KSB3 bacterium TaxID=2044937 RepID=A0A9D5JX50_9BACT|nr:bacteriocin [candidate division KSB3 bacterium]MBD3325759.1 bacteriocin [candidate division KSB3 bacterium]